MRLIRPQVKTPYESVPFIYLDSPYWTDEQRYNLVEYGWASSVYFDETGNEVI